ncbi:hypothetical protein BGZ95_008927 [Linnemannia exigua]|uniref:Uncharacterized protein n=1 Tax=Linnemannia exigua TaxID=604196 RepID=A0AAD4H7G3_9FUNG|nr:hypothetical protein BGZ95_008927 [Linnemannia exigua]
MVVQDLKRIKTETNTSSSSDTPRKQQQQRRSTVQDEDKEVLDKFIVIDSDDDEDDLEFQDQEYYPNPDDDALEEKETELEYNEEEEDLSADITHTEDQAREEHEAEMVKSDEREVQAGGASGRRRGTSTRGETASTAAKESAKRNNSKNDNEREVQAGGGRRRSTGTGGEVASTASSNDNKSSNKNTSNNNSSGDRDDKDETTHDKRSRAGHTGASAKVGFVDSDIAMTRAKYKIDGPEEGSDPLHDVGKPPASRREPESPTPDHPGNNKDDIATWDVGTKLWHKIYASCYPSELEGAGSANKKWRTRVYHLPVWQEICEKAGLALPAAQLEALGHEKPDYYKLAHENADVICEQCYKMTRPAGSFRALPVAMADSDPPTMIRMCRDCRVDYYIEHPESTPDDVAPYKAGDYTVTPRMTKGDAKKAYLLSDWDIMSLPYEMGRNPYFGSKSPMYLFEEQHVLRLARQVHGGDIGIAAARADSEHAGRKIPEPHDDVAKHRRNLLRSMLHDKGLHLPEHAAISNIYIETGLGDPVEIVKELEVVDWFHQYTSYDPSLNKAHLQQVKRRPRISRGRETHPEGATLMSANTGGSTEQSIKDEVMSEGEEEEDDQHRMAALDEWLTHRLEQGRFQSYKSDPDTPERPPKAIWPVLDKIDMSHKMIEFAAEKVYKVLEKKKHELRREGALDKIAKSKAQVREIVDTPQRGSSARVFELSRRKRRKVEDGDESDDDDDQHRQGGKKGHSDELKLSTVMEHSIGSNWHTQVHEQAKALIKSRLH